MTAQLPGPGRPVPYSLTPKAEAALAAADPEPGLGPYPTFDDNPAKWGLQPEAPMTEAELKAAGELEPWGPEGPYASYAEYLADRPCEPEPEAEP